jgi:TPR repeat protein
VGVAADRAEALEWLGAHRRRATPSQPFSIGNLYFLEASAARETAKLAQAVTFFGKAVELGS